MFDDLDASLAALLADGAAPPEVRAADVNFAAPDKDFTPGQPTLDLFLHEVQENRALRDVHPGPASGAGRRLAERAAPVAGRLHLPRHRLVCEDRGVEGRGGAPPAGPCAAVARPVPRSSRPVRAGNAQGAAAALPAGHDRGADP